MARNAPATEASKSKPRYRLTEKCYLDGDRYYDPEMMPFDPDSETGERKPLIVTFEGPPAYYMEPMNEAAEAMVAKHPERMQFRDPVMQMAQLTPPAADSDAIVGMLAAALANMARVQQPKPTA